MTTQRQYRMYWLREQIHGLLEKLNEEMKTQQQYYFRDYSEILCLGAEIARLSHELVPIEDAERKVYRNRCAGQQGRRERENAA